MNLAEHLHRAAKARPSSPAIYEGATLVQTYADLNERAARLASGLRFIMGLGAGERVAILSKNGPRYLEALYAVWRAGLVATPINARLHPSEISYILRDVGARLCLAGPGLGDAAATAADGAPIAILEMGGADYEALARSEPFAIAETQPDDPAWIFYTSGTTGRPKGAVLTNRNLLAMSACCLLDVDSEAPWTTLLHAAPMSHGSGLYAIPYVMKGAAHVTPESGGFDPSEVYELLKAHKGVSFFAAPTMVKLLTDHDGDADTRNLKTIAYGGGPMHVEECVRALDRFGPKLSQLYGQGESPMTITALTIADHQDDGHGDWRARLGSVGRPQSLVEVRVAGADDQTLPAGEIGEILVRGDTVMAGYWNNPAATEETLRGGWLHTGDMGAFDEAGYLTLKDRSKDLIISGGHNVYPREVEEVLLAHPGVSEVSVIGREDPKWGEMVVACVVATTGAPLTESDLDAFCLDRMARFKRPRAYRFLDALPKNNYGKVLKTELRASDQTEAARKGGS